MMTHFYVPYCGMQPALLSINGHNVLLVSRDSIDIEEMLNYFGADSIRTLDMSESIDDYERELEELTEVVNGDVVIAPEDVHIAQVLSELEEELPWIQ